MTKPAAVPKRDGYLKPLYDRLKKSTSPMSLGELIAVTICKGLKSVSPKVIEDVRERMENDDRFTITLKAGEDGVGTYIDLSERNAPTTPPIDDEPPEDDSGKTIGELLADQEANGEPAKDSTLAQPISEAKPETPPAAAPLTDQETHDLMHKAMTTHIEISRANAVKFAEMKRNEASLQGELTMMREEIKEHVKASMAHDSAVPTVESLAQRTIAFDTGPGPVPEEKWPYALPADQTLKLADTGLTFSDLEKKIVGDLPYQEKPHQLGDLIVEIKGSRYLIRESSMDDKRWFAQPVCTKDEWQQLHEASFGRPLEDFDQNDEAKGTRQAGGPDCGRVVKAGRSKVVLGPNSHGLVITVENPPETGVELDARQLAAGDTPDDNDEG